MPQFAINEFGGIDVRRNAALSDPRTFVVADNVVITAGRGVERRPAWKRIGRMNENSVGLYSLNGQLRAVAPGGQLGIARDVPPGMRYDLVGNGSPYFPGSLGAFKGVEPVGASVTGGVFPFVSVVHDGIQEMHWIDVEPTTLGDPVNTLVNVPFLPTTNIIKLASKVWAGAQINGAVYFSSTANGPRDWSEPNDAGFLPVLQHITGERTITGMGYFKNRLVVMFADAIQIWAVDPDPSNHFLVDVLNGPGTENGDTVENVLGDLMFFSRGGFRSLRESSISGTLRDGDIGSPVFDLTKELDASSAKSVWVQSRGLYFTAFGNEAYVLSVHPLSKIVAWTRWTAPFEIAHVAIHEGELHVRDTDHNIYRLDDDLEDDCGTPINWAIETQFLDMKRPNQFKKFDFMTAVADGEFTVQFRAEPGAPLTDGPTVSGVTRHTDKIAVPALSAGLSLRLSGSKACQLDSLSLYFEQLRA